MFLSVDLDYWNDDSADLSQIEPFLKLVLGASKQQDAPAFACTNHQQMLKAINISNARTLVNIDYHSDLCEPDVTELNCGTWVGYTRWRQQGRYVWLRPHPTPYDGACNASKTQLNRGSWRHGTDWKKAQGLYIRPKHLTRCVNQLLKTHILKGVGFCLSPSFSCPDLLTLGNKLVHQFKLPFLQGRNNENYGRKCKPPFNSYRT